MMKFAVATVAAMVMSTAANAAYVVTVKDTADGITAIGSGTINTAALTLFQNANSAPTFHGDAAALVTGRATFADPAGNVQILRGVSGPRSWDGAFFRRFSFGTDDLVGIIGSSGLLFVPVDYQSGRMLTSGTTFVGATLASLDVAEGVYTYRWGAGVDADSFTVRIGNVPAGAVPEPASWAMMIAGVGLVGGAMRRRKVATTVSFA